MSKTLDRIKKLLKLAGNGAAGEHEADTARRLAEAMANAAGISLDDLAREAASDADPAATVDLQHGAKAREGWRGTVAVAVARLVGCYCYREHPRAWPKDQRYRIVWIGTLEQRETAIALHDWVMKQINFMARGVIYRLRERRDTKGFVAAYRYGVADAIADQALRIGAARKKQQASADTTALALQDRVQAAIEKLKPETKKAKGRGVRSDGFHVGRFDGEQVRLQHDVGGGAQRLRLGGGS